VNLLPRPQQQQQVGAQRQQQDRKKVVSRDGKVMPLVERQREIAQSGHKHGYNGCLGQLPEHHADLQKLRGLLRLSNADSAEDAKAAELQPIRDDGSINRERWKEPQPHVLRSELPSTHRNHAVELLTGMERLARNGCQHKREGKWWQRDACVALRFAGRP
jgi:hypothetical protein